NSGYAGRLAIIEAMTISDDQFADFVGDGHGFDDGESASIAGVFTAIAAAAAIERGSVHDTGINAKILVHFDGVGHGLLAMGTDAAHEALGAGQNDGRGNKEGRDAHVVQPSDGARSVITVHGAQNLV